LLAILVAFAVGLGAELAFRGAAHGALARMFRMSYPPSRWVPSVPVLLSAALYGIATLLLGLGDPLARVAALAPSLAWVSVALGALVIGLAAGLARDRSGSVLAAVAVHFAGTLAVALAAWS
jgi:membrane protease YdiL (CAAX protease family)